MSKKTRTVREMHQTCHACPSQWEGHTTDGAEVYIRYRWGFLSCDLDREQVYGRQVGDGLHGVMDTETMQRLLSAVLDFQETEGAASE